MPEVTLKKGDTTPEFQATLEDAAQEFDGDETVRFYMEGPSDPNGPAGDLLVNAVIPEDNIRYEDPENPEITYDFGAGQTSQNGTCRAEVVVIYGDGEVQSFPEGQFYTIEVNDTLRREIPPEQPLTDVHVDVETVDADTVSAPALKKIESLVGPATDEKELSNFEGENVSIDDEGNLNSPDTDTQLSDEQVQDIVGAFVAGDGATSVSYDDEADTLTISSTDENTQLSDEEIEDVVGSLLTASGSASVNYDDSDGTVTIGATDTDTQLSESEVQTIVEAYLSGGTNVEISVVDGSLTIDADHDHAGDQLGTESEPVGPLHAGESHIESLSVNDDASSRTLKLDGRTDMRPAYSDALDLYISAPGIDAGGANTPNSDVIFENGMQLDVFVDSDVTDDAPNDYVSERLKFLPSGEFGIETDVPSQPVTISSENGGGIRFETADGEDDGKHKETRLKINGGQNQLESVEWRSMKRVSFREYPYNDSHAGRINLGLADDLTPGFEMEFDGSRFTMQAPNTDDVIDFLHDDGAIGLRLYQGDVTFGGSDGVDLSGSQLRGDGNNSRVSLDNFLSVEVRGAAPSTPQSGDIAMQDGANWNPAGTGDERIVVYQNGNWVAAT